jgi:hypothetical protein
MGKHFNAELYRQFDRTMDKGLDEAMGDTEPPLTTDELESQHDDAYWERLDAVRRYARANCHVDIWDEMRRAA